MTTTAAGRALNFSAGPGTLPEPVLRQAQEDLWSIDGTGIGIAEHSHRGATFSRIIEEARGNCRALGDIGDDHEILFLQGGASLQFAMIPMNYLPPDATADYPDTGIWTTKAIVEARRFGTVNVPFDGGACGYDHVPAADEMALTDGAEYLHYCSNNTIYGTRWQRPPATTAPLIADMSSEMFSRPVDFGAHALAYAGAQKNLGPAGATLVIIHRELLDRDREDLPTMLRYRTHASKGSCLNTPPTFAIHVMGLVFRWMLDRGGLRAIESANDAKASLLYDAIESSGGFWRPVARPDSRSVMNIPFRSPDEDADARFLEAAGKEGMSGLKGHRNVGGLRASIYNAFPEEGCRRLAECMTEFARTNG